MPADDDVSCQIVSMAGLALCVVNVDRASTVHDLKEVIASKAFLPRIGWCLMLGSDMLHDSAEQPLHFVGASITLNVVHVDANIGRAKQAAECLQDSNIGVRRQALGELAILGDAATVAAPVLVELLHDDDLVICMLAAQVLGGLLDVARPVVVPALESLLQKTNKTINSDLLYDDFMDLPECECMSSEADWSPALRLRDATIDALKQLNQGERWSIDGFSLDGCDSSDEEF